MVERSELAPDLSISRIVTGLWQIADLERKGKVLKQEDTTPAIKAYIQSGFTSFDMADHYGTAEIITGQYKKDKDPDEELQLLTKWVPSPGKVSRKDVRKAVQLSLDRMQSSTLDLMQFHAWNYADPNWLDCLFWLEELRTEGLIRHIGLTNVDADHLRIVLSSGIRVVSNQISYSLLDQRAAGKMTQVCEEFGIKLLVFGVLSGGFLTKKWLRKVEPKAEHLETWSQMKYKRYIDVAGGWSRFQELLRILEKIAIAKEVSMSTVAAKYMLDQPAVGAVILGSRLGKSDHIEENLKISRLVLSEEDRSQINEVITKFTPIPGNCGDEYRKPPFLTAIGDLSHHLSSIPPPFKAIRAPNGQSRVLSGTIWEDIAGFSRAVRTGNRILVSGTTATHGSKLIGGPDPVAQTHFVIDKIKGAIESLGGEFSNIIRTRIYINDKSYWEPVARAHGERFKLIQPVNTMVIAGLIGEGYQVEIEAEAIVA